MQQIEKILGCFMDVSCSPHLMYGAAFELKARQFATQSRSGLVNPISHIDVGDVNFHSLFSAPPSCVGFALCD